MYFNHLFIYLGVAIAILIDPTRLKASQRSKTAPSLNEFSAALPPVYLLPGSVALLLMFAWALLVRPVAVRAARRPPQQQEQQAQHAACNKRTPCNIYGYYSYLDSVNSCVQPLNLVWRLREGERGVLGVFLGGESPSMCSLRNSHAATDSLGFR